MRSAAGEATRPDVRHAVPPVARSEVGVDAGYRRARLVTLTALGTMFVSSAAMPAIGLGVEQRLPSGDQQGDPAHRVAAKPVEAGRSRVLIA